MSDDLADSVVGLLPHLPGWSALGLAALSLFRGGRGLGRAESRIKTHDEKLEALEARVGKAEQDSAALALKIAERPNRDEMRQMFADSNERTREMIGAVREDIRDLRRAP